MGAEQNHRVLVVDDNPAIHEDFRKVLAGRANGELDALDAELFGSAPAAAAVDFQIDSAFQGKEALDHVARAGAEQRPYALAFVDMRMPPGWDGAETSARILAADPAIHVVVCTAYSDYELEDLVAKTGAVDRLLVLKKPFDSVEVRQLAQALTRKWALLKVQESYLGRLESEVRARTEQIVEANRRLREEMEQRLRIQGELQRAQKLDALGQLTAGIGHEINNPLACIMGNLTFIAQVLERPPAEVVSPELTEARTAIGEAHDGATRIKQIVRDIRAFSQLDQDNRTSCSLRHAAQEALRILDHELQHRASVVVELGDTPPVRGSAGKLTQVLIGLLMNAMQALPKERNDGRISVRSRLRGERVVVEVADTGCGIPAAHIERVFDPFFTTKPVGESSGLGLSTCHGIISALAGSIVVKSREGEGTTVRIELPLAEQAKEQAPAPGAEPRSELPQVAPEKPAGPRGRILVVDDDAHILATMRRQLRDHALTLCSGVREALAAYDAAPHDLVLCDMMMPGESGIAMYEGLAARGPDHLRRLVFITGGAFTEVTQRFIDSHDVPCLDKPVLPETLEQVITEKLAARTPAAADPDQPSERRNT